MNYINLFGAYYNLDKIRTVKPSSAYRSGKYVPELILHPENGDPLISATGGQICEDHEEAKALAKTVFLQAVSNGLN